MHSNESASRPKFVVMHSWPSETFGVHGHACIKFEKRDIRHIEQQGTSKYCLHWRDWLLNKHQGPVTLISSTLLPHHVTGWRVYDTDGTLVRFHHLPASSRNSRLCLFDSWIMAMMHSEKSHIGELPAKKMVD